MRRALAAALTSLLLIAAGCIVVAAGEERHQLGSNWVRPVQFAVGDLQAGDRLCQAGARLPEGTGAVGLRIGTYDRPGPRLVVRVDGNGARELEGRLAAGWEQGDVVVPIPELDAERRDARICLTHQGPGALAVAGGPGVGPAAQLRGNSIGQLIRIEYLEADPRPWWAAAGSISDRIGVARDALPGVATLPVFGLFALVLLAGTFGLVLREGRE